MFDLFLGCQSTFSHLLNGEYFLCTFEYLQKPLHSFLVASLDVGMSEYFEYRTKKVERKSSVDFLLLRRVSLSESTLLIGFRVALRESSRGHVAAVFAHFLPSDLFMHHF